MEEKEFTADELIAVYEMACKIEVAADMGFTMASERKYKILFRGIEGMSKQIIDILDNFME